MTKPLSEFDVSDVLYLLVLLKMSRYCAAFEENAIDGPTLVYCHSVDDVTELGIDIISKARVLFNEINKLKEINEVETISETMSLTSELSMSEDA